MHCITANYVIRVHENGKVYQDFALSVNVKDANNQAVKWPKMAGRRVNMNTKCMYTTS